MDTLNFIFEVQSLLDHGKSLIIRKLGQAAPISWSEFNSILDTTRIDPCYFNAYSRDTSEQGEITLTAAIEKQVDDDCQNHNYEGVYTLLFH